MNITIALPKSGASSAASGIDSSSIRARIAALQKKLVDTQKELLKMSASDPSTATMRELLRQAIELLQTEIARLQMEAAQQSREQKDDDKGGVEKPEAVTMAIAGHISVHA